MEPNGHALFTETQRFDQLWARAACVIIFTVCAYMMYQMGSGWRESPACARPPLIVFALVMLVLGLGMAVTTGMLLGSMTTVIDHQQVRVRMLFFTRSFPLHAVTAFSPVTYSALGEYGGWGFKRKFGDRSTMAYTTSGDRGVMLELSDGRKILVGSKQTEALEHALRMAKGHQE